MDIRDYHGFRQHKECGKWVFSVAGFDYLGNKNRCSVLLTAGVKREFPLIRKTGF